MNNKDSEQNLLSQGLADVLAELVSNIGVARAHTAQEIEELSDKFCVMSVNINKIQELSKELIQISSLKSTKETQKSAQQLHNQLQNYNQDIGQDIQTIMMTLQFQDRVNQILQQVEENLTDLSAQKETVDWQQLLIQTTETFQRFDGGWTRHEKSNEEKEPVLF